jgi:hypothetical protein
MVRYPLEHYIYLCDICVKYGSARKRRWKFRRKFRTDKDPSRKTIHSLVNELRSTGILIDKKQKHKCRVFTEEKLDDIGARFEHAPRKSLKRLAQETKLKKKLNSVAFSPQANYTDRATAACWRSYCQLLRIEDVAWSEQRIPPVVNSVFSTGAATFSFK